MAKCQETHFIAHPKQTNWKKQQYTISSISQHLVKIRVSVNTISAEREYTMCTRSCFIGVAT